MEYTVKGLAGLAGVSPRTLRYYDGIGLLKPAYINESGYRIYGDGEVDALQQILFYREMGMGLGGIQNMMADPDFNRVQVLREHLAALKQRQEQMNLLIKNVTKTIEKEEGKTDMTDKEKFEGLKRELLEENEAKYGVEIREKYGEDAVEESNAKMLNLTRKEYGRMQELGCKINEMLEQAVKAGENPAGELGQKIADMHREWLAYTWNTYSKEAHSGLVRMYTEDERFQMYYDKNMAGCAGFLRDAVLISNAI